MDSARLKYEIKKKGKSIDEFCNDIGFSKSAFYRKCNGNSEFTQEEINSIVKYLSIDDPRPIFFPDLVS